MGRIHVALSVGVVLGLGACKGGLSLSTQAIADTGWVIDLPSGYKIGADGSITDDKGEWGDIAESDDPTLDNERALQTCSADEEREVEKLPNGMIITCHSSMGYSSRSWIKADEGKLKICYWNQGDSRADARAVCASLRKK